MTATITTRQVKNMGTEKKVSLRVFWGKVFAFSKKFVLVHSMAKKHKIVDAPHPKTEQHCFPPERRLFRGEGKRGGEGRAGEGGQRPEREKVEEEEATHS